MSIRNFHAEGHVKPENSKEKPPWGNHTIHVEVQVELSLKSFQKTIVSIVWLQAFHHSPVLVLDRALINLSTIRETQRHQRLSIAHLRMNPPPVSISLHRHLLPRNLMTYPSSYPVKFRHIGAQP